MIFSGRVDVTVLCDIFLVYRHTRINPTGFASFLRRAYAGAPGREQRQTAAVIGKGCPAAEPSSLLTIHGAPGPQPPKAVCLALTQLGC